MSEQCACGNASGTNDECERCRLIDQLNAARNRVAELESFAMIEIDNASLRARVADLEQESQQEQAFCEKRVQGLRHQLQIAIRDLIRTIRTTNCPNGNSFADCYDIPTYTGEPTP